MKKPKPSQKVRNNNKSRTKDVQLRRSIMVLAAISIIGFALTLLFLGEGVMNSGVIKEIGIQGRDFYGIFFIISILFIASIATLLYFRKNKKS